MSAHAGFKGANKLAASQGGVAMMRWSKDKPLICQIFASSSCSVNFSMRVPSLQVAPLFSSQRTAACGKISPKSILGNNRSELPGGPKIASFRTRKNTVPLAWSAGVFKADTHKGSIKSCQMRGDKPTHTSRTVNSGAHSNCMRCQRAAVLSSDHLSEVCQPLAMAMPQIKLSGKGCLGSDKPRPFASFKLRGMRHTT